MKKPTERQQIQQWIKDSPFVEYSEQAVADVFEIAMGYKENHPDWELENLYAYAFIVYVNKTLE